MKPMACRYDMAILGARFYQNGKDWYSRKWFGRFHRSGEKRYDNTGIGTLKVETYNFTRMAKIGILGRISNVC